MGTVNMSIPKVALNSLSLSETIGTGQVSIPKVVPNFLSQNTCVQVKCVLRRFYTTFFSRKPWVQANEYSNSCFQLSLTETIGAGRVRIQLPLTETMGTGKVCIPKVVPNCLLQTPWEQAKWTFRLYPKKGKTKSPGSATITKRSPSQTPRGRENKQNQTSANRTNVRKAQRLALSSQSEVIAMLKGLKTKQKKNTR